MAVDMQSKPKLLTLPSRSPVVPTRKLPLSEQDREYQIRKGLFTSQHGQRYAIPCDNVKEPEYYQYQRLWKNDKSLGLIRHGVRSKPYGSPIQKQVLTFLRDKVHKDIPYWYYLATLGHDLHVSTYANLYAKHFHNDWANPFNPEKLDEPLEYNNPAVNGLHGFIEELGWLRGAKVTDVFVSEEIAELVSATGTEYADFDFHEVGLSTQAENNNDTALITTSGIARVTGSPTDADPIYRNVGTITADVTETWEEHGLFNNSSGAALMDRSDTSGQSVNLNDQVQYTYELTKAPEA